MTQAMKRYPIKQLVADFKALPWYQELGILTVVSIIVVLPCWLLYGFFGREYQPSRVTGLQWSRSIDVEEFRVVHESDTTWSPPRDAYNVNRWTEYWTESHDTYDSKGNVDGSYNTIESEDHYSYDVNRWRLRETYTSDGVGKKTKWPDIVLKMGPLGKKDRAGKRRSKYIVNLLGEEGAKKFECPEEEWRTYEDNQEVIAVVNGFGWVVGIDVGHD